MLMRESYERPISARDGADLDYHRLGHYERSFRRQRRDRALHRRRPSTAAQLGISILAGPGFSVDDSFLVVGVPLGRHPETLDAMGLSFDYLLRSYSVSSRGSSHS